MQQEINKRNQLEIALREAISNDRLELYIQPQVTSDRQVVGMEALLRWHDPEQGTISPAEFIPIAEASGLIIPLGEWVLQRACHILAQWQRLPELEHTSLAVNVSPHQFRHPRFIEQVSSAIEQAGIDPTRLELEITESLLIDDTGSVIKRMQTLRDIGLRFSLDDFGTGYASLGYLKLLPIYQLKIDQSFVREVLTDPNDEAIVKTIIALAASLELDVIAEGVETAEQAQRVQQLGCKVFQGYYYGEPAPAEHWQRRFDQGKGIG
jgi:EAL domain-containing protein (putative c-di-GMP-specific phosphodiesterase class I)